MTVDLPPCVTFSHVLSVARVDARLVVWSGSRKLVLSDTCIPESFSSPPVLKSMAKKAMKAAAAAPKAAKAMKAKKA